MNTTLDLPRKLGRCIQDVNAQGIKVRHKLRVVVALKNPDGHVSEVSIHKYPMYCSMGIRPRPTVSQRSKWTGRSEGERLRSGGHFQPCLASWVPPQAPS